MKHKIFTLDQANRTLPLVRRIVEDLMARYGEFRPRGEELERLREEKPRSDRVLDLEREIGVLADAINALVAELEQIGCQAKDLDRGLVDFFSEMDGEIVYLCWRHGEDRIRFWHTLEAGFSGRRPLPAGAE